MLLHRVALHDYIGSRNLLIFRKLVQNDIVLPVFGFVHVDKKNTMHIKRQPSASQKLNSFMPTVPTFAVRETDGSRHNGGPLSAPLKPLRDDSALRALSSLMSLMKSAMKFNSININLLCAFFPWNQLYDTINTKKSGYRLNFVLLGTYIYASLKFIMLFLGKKRITDK